MSLKLTSMIIQFVVMILISNDFIWCRTLADIFWERLKFPTQSNLLVGLVCQEFCKKSWQFLYLLSHAANHISYFKSCLSYNFKHFEYKTGIVTQKLWKQSTKPYHILQQNGCIWLKLFLNPTDIFVSTTKSKIEKPVRSTWQSIFTVKYSFQVIISIIFNIFGLNSFWNK